MNLLTNKTPHSFKELRRGNLVTLGAKMQFIKFWGPKCNFGKISRSEHNFGKFWGQNTNLEKVVVEMQI